MENKEKIIGKVALDALLSLENLTEDFAQMYKRLMDLSDLLKVEENERFFNILNWLPEPDTMEDLGDKLAELAFIKSQKKQGIGA